MLQTGTPREIYEHPSRVSVAQFLGVGAHDIVDSFLIEKRLTTSWTPG
jgi:ABC-type Fe3+/spermidine/putrescine transport system ATPase subunit